MNAPLIKPIEHSRLECIVVRALFAWLVWGIFPDYGSMPYGAQPKPHGLAETFGFDFTFLASSDPLVFAWTPYALCRALAALALIAYTLGLAPWLTLTYTTWFFVCFGTLMNSQGFIGHYLQLTGMVLLGISAYHIYHRVRYRSDTPGTPDQFRRALQVGQQLAVAGYVTSAVSKSLSSGFFGWIGRTENFPVALVKAERMHYFNSLTVEDSRNLPLMEAFGKHLGELLITNPGLGPLIIGPGLVLEAAALLLIINRGWNVAGALTFIAFHLGIGGLMNLPFLLNIHLLLVFFIAPNVVYWLQVRFRQNPHPAPLTPAQKR